MPPFAVITRDPARAAPYAAALTSRVPALTPLAMPLLADGAPPDPAALARALAGTAFAHVVITSPRGATAVVRALAVASLRKQPTLWAVGPATAAILTAAGYAPQTSASPDDGAALARSIVARHDLAGLPILLPRAAGARDDVTTILRAASAELHEVIAYAMVPLPASAPELAAGLAALRAGDAAVCAVFAPSQVHALALQLGTATPLPTLAARTRFIAIGRTTGVALREAGVADPTIASAATPEAMADAVASVYPTRR